MRLIRRRRPAPTPTVTLAADIDQRTLRHLARNGVNVRDLIAVEQGANGELLARTYVRRTDGYPLCDGANQPVTTVMVVPAPEVA